MTKFEEVAQTDPCVSIVRFIPHYIALLGTICCIHACTYTGVLGDDHGKGYVDSPHGPEF